MSRAGAAMALAGVAGGCALLLGGCGLRLGGTQPLAPVPLDPGAYASDSALVQGLLLGPVRLVRHPAGESGVYYRLQSFDVQDEAVGHSSSLEPVARLQQASCTFVRLGTDGGDGAANGDAGSGDGGPTSVNGAAGDGGGDGPASLTFAARQGYSVNENRPLSAAESRQAVKSRLAWECVRRLTERVQRG